MALENTSKDGSRRYVSIWMPTELHEELKGVAQAERRSVSNMVYILIKRALKARDVPQQQ